MDLNLERPGNHYFVNTISDQGVQIGNEFHSTTVIVSASRLKTDWPVQKVEELCAEQLEVVLEFKPEILLIGTGKTQVFLPPELMMFIYGRNTGFEVMTTDAAARTFNVLVTEGRNVVAVLMPIGPAF